MANVPQPGSGPPSSRNDSNASNTLSWEGDKMFNIYIYDYCFKRGFRKTAQELLAEAEIPPESQPPINARQGLLFEWWSVFWVLFTAKANGSGSEDALIYTQHQAQQANNRQQRQAGPSTAPMVQPMQQPALGRQNNIPQGRPFMANGVLPNTGPSGAPGFATGPHMNGVPGPQGPQSAPPNQPGQPQNFQPPIPGQRGSMGGPQRIPNGAPPFQSPTMANSPQTTGSAPGQPPSLQPGQQPPMGQLGPSPHMGPVHRAMHPPNGPQGMQPVQSQPPQGQAPNSYSLGRPPSRTASPGQMPIMSNQSPSMANRQAPGVPPQAIEVEYSRIPPTLHPILRSEAGLDGKDFSAFTIEDKQRMINAYRRSGRKPGPGGLNAGPSNIMPPNQRNPPGPGPSLGPGGRTKRNSTSPGEEPESMPGAGSSPPDRKRPRRSPVEQSPYPHPPQQMSHQPPPQSGPPGSGPPQQPPMNGMMRSMGAPMNGGYQGGMPPQPLGGQMNMNMGNPGGHQMSNAMSPMTGGMPGQGGVMTPQLQPMTPQQQQNYRNSMNNFHSRQMHQTGMPAAGSPNAEAPFGGNNPPQGAPASAPPFGAPPGANNRMAQKPANGGMMPPPPPSPGMNKDAANKEMKPEGSPQNGHTPNATGTGGSTPVPTLNQPPPPQNPTPNPPPNMAPSPSSLLANSAMNSMMVPPSTLGSASDNLFSVSENFINMPNVLDDFAPGFFDSGGMNIGGVDFERDFNQWFNPDDIANTNLDSMK